MYLIIVHHLQSTILSKDNFDSYLSDIKSNHYEPNCNLSSNLYLYFEKHMTDSEKAQFKNYNDFKEKFFSETRINKEVFIVTSTISDIFFQLIKNLTCHLLNMMNTRIICYNIIISKMNKLIQN